jgi:hypothetical protein
MRIAQLLATFASGLFAGASIYINLVEHPARMQCGIPLALEEFAPSYKRAAVMQVSLAAIGSLSALIVWLNVPDIMWLIGGGLLLAVIPFTLIVILPTNKKLLDPAMKSEPELARKLLTLWGRLHAVRSILSLTSWLIFLFLLGNK